MNSKLIFISVFMSFTLIKAQIITTVVGGGTNGLGDGGSAIAASLNGPFDVNFDTKGNMYIADAGNNRIRKVNTLGTITSVAGNGTLAFSGDGGQATGAEFSTPQSIAIDAAGNLYIADFGNHRVRMVNSTGLINTVVGAGSNSTVGIVGAGGQATAAYISLPEGVALDANGNLFVADYFNNNIYNVNNAGIINVFAGAINANVGYSGDGGLATAALLSEPTAVAFDALGNLYISDSENNVIRKISTSNIITTVVGNGFDASTGQGGFSGDGGQATSAELDFPTGRIAVDKVGNLFFADSYNNRVRKVSTLGIITTIAGNGTQGFSGDGGPAINAVLSSPGGVALDSLGNLYIVDNGNSRIRMISNAGTTTNIKLLSDADKEINIYPNPCVSYFVVDLKNTNEQTLQIYDINGNLILTQSINNKTKIDISNIANGVYNLSFISNEGTINKKLVIVKSVN